MDSSPHLIIRADADARIGTGHVMRCIALGQAWQDAGGVVIFMTVCDNETMLQRLRDELFTVVLLTNTTDFLTELGHVECGTGTPWTVLDGYHFDLACQRAVRAAGYKLLLIDDYNHQPEYECDILLNQNVDAAGINYSINKGALLLSGTDYAMLRREFRSGAGMNRSFPHLGKNILVTLGGADPDNLSLKVIQALQLTSISELQVKVVVGPANQFLAELEQAVAAFEMDIELLGSVKDMTPLMHWADLAVSAGGSTCWEFCCLGLPFLTIVIADNQRGLAKELALQGVAPCLGENPACEQMAQQIQSLVVDAEIRKTLSQKARALVDGFGVDRVLYRAARDTGLDPFTDRLFLRKVSENDSELLWNWANDPSVRSQCYSSDPIPWASHQVWFSGKVETDDALMLIFELDGCPVGQIRYDRDGGMVHIGFSIDRKFRGLGLGGRIVRDSLDLAFNMLDVTCIQAEVFADNAASNRVFLQCGFKFVKKTEIDHVLSNIYIKEQG